MTDYIEKDLDNKSFIEFMKDKYNKIEDGKSSIEDIKKEVANYFKTKNKKEKDLEQTLIDEIDRCRTRDYNIVINDHKRLISKGGLATGYKCLDDYLIFQKTDFIVIQGMSNHGKSSFMSNLNYHFLTNKENERQNPLCIHIAYEAHMIRTEEKFLNIISYDLEKKVAIEFDRTTNTDLLNPQKRKGNYLYLSNENNQKAIDLYNSLIKNEKLMIMKKQSIESLPILIDMLKERHPDRTIVLFLDYLQILPNSFSSTGWEKMKELSYWLENLAIEKEIIIFTGSQVNENRDTREGKDIYNACTINLDIFNNSHDLLKDHEKLQNYYKPKIEGNNVVTLTCRKQKFGPTFTNPEAFLFNGFVFEEKQISSNENQEVATKNNKKFNRYDYKD